MAWTPSKSWVSRLFLGRASKIIGTAESRHTHTHKTQVRVVQECDAIMTVVQHTGEISDGLQYSRPCSRHKITPSPAFFLSALAIHVVAVLCPLSTFISKGQCSCTEINCTLSCAEFHWTHIVCERACVRAWCVCVCVCLRVQARTRVPVTCVPVHASLSVCESVGFCVCAFCAGVCASASACACVWLVAFFFCSVWLSVYVSRKLRDKIFLRDDTPSSTFYF